MHRPRPVALLGLGLALVALAAACDPPPPVAPSGRRPQLAPPSTAPSSPSATPDQTDKPAGSGYDKPPPNVLDVLRAPSPPVPYVSPTGDSILLVSWVDYPPMARVAEPFLKLAGVRVEPKNRRKHDTPGGYGIPPCAREMTLGKLATGTEIHVALPAGRCVEAPYWAADAKRFSFRSTSADAVELWVGDATTGEVHGVPGVKLNPILGSVVQWMPDQKSLLVKLVPDNAGPPPPAPIVPAGPSIQETTGQKGESSTYEARDVLTSKHDEDLFDYYATAQLALVDVTTNAVTRVGKPGIYTSVDVAPGGDHVLVETLKKPYSYVTTFDRFAHDVEIWDRSGKVVHALASLPIADRVPVHGVPTGPRAFDWRATEPATLVWAEALDGGDWKAKVPARDKVMTNKAPFSTAPTELLRTEQRYGGFSWGEQPGLAFLREQDENRHWARTLTVNVDEKPAKPKVLWDLSTDEKYKHPGSPVMRELPNGAWVVRQEGDLVYLAGQGSSVDGDRPFLDRLDTKARTTERLFRSEKTAYENFLAITEPGAKTFLTWHQTPIEPPNAFLRSLGDKVPNAAPGEPAFGSAAKQLTHIADPTPVVRAIKKRIVKYKRKDGTDLSFTVYTPPDYQEGKRVPSILYAYPLDYADPSKAGQLTGSEQTFTRLRQYRLLLLAGYAIIDNTAFPIVGDPKKAYDTYLEQLVADAKAAVEKAIEIGVADPDRIGITGHSHGALMTVNLLAHTDLFRAGVATSGSYNKTLTPFGFQNERRSVWEAQSVYLKASPFFFADKLKLPLLIMHGADDANPGTTPLQATKLYEAVRGNGGTARLVMLPHEPHWYAAQESNEQLVAEMIRWFDKYVKNAPAPRGGRGTICARSCAAPMNRISSFHALPFVLLSGATVLGACDEDTGSIGQRRGSSSGSNTSSGGSDGPSDGEKLFRALEGDLVKTCGGSGGTCHVSGSYPGNPPTFLAGPDAYVSITGFPSIVVRDPSQSALLNKTQHEGPGLTPDSDLKKKCEEWIGVEALAITNKKLPTTAPVTVTNGANDVDLSSAASPGANVGSVHLKFDASLIGGILSISNMRLATPAGAAVHLFKPRFVRISKGREDVDPADTFSNTDQTVPGGAETKLTPGFALFSGDSWTPFDLAADQIRIEVEKLEPGTIPVIDTPKVCKNPTLFGTAVLPTIRTTMAANGTCNSCHANNTAPQIGGNDTAAICINILGRLNATNIQQSLMITKVTSAGHTGGLVANPTAWTALFVNNKAVFF